MLIYFASMHSNGVLLLLFGLPFERALPWHRMLAISTFVQSLIHGLAYYFAHKRLQSPIAKTHFMDDMCSYGFAMETTGARHRLRTCVSCVLCGCVGHELPAAS
jgi:Ferric reductase like transmembrane component